MKKTNTEFDKYLNTDFRIVIDKRGYHKSGERKKNRHLVGRRGLKNLLGMDLYIKVVTRAYKGNSPKITIKLRRGVDIIFYLK